MSALPDDSPGRHAFEVVMAEFSDGMVTSEVVVDAPDVTTPAVQRGVEQMVALLEADPGFGNVTRETSDQGNLVLLRAVMKVDPSSADANAAVGRVRNEYVAATFGGGVADVYVGGDTAESMDAVFGGFALGDLVMMQQMGFGLGVAVFLDATVVRSVLVPASMELLGDWNWYLPTWLEWLPRIEIEGAAPVETAETAETLATPMRPAAQFEAVAGGGS